MGKGRFFFFIILLAEIYTVPLASGDALPVSNDFSSFEGYTDRGNGSGFFIMPSAGISLSGEGYRENDARYDGATRRMLDLDIFRYRNYLLYMNVSEIIIFKERGSTRYPPSIIRYEMDYGGLGWEFSSGMASLYFDHICDNAINRNDTLPMQLRWYGAGLRWETYGIRTGRKDGQIAFSGGDSFEWLNSINYRVSAARALSTRSFDYRYMFTMLMRYDILRFHFIVPYLEGLFTGIVDSRARVDRRFEGGVRLHLENADIIPYAGYQYKHDTDLYNGLDAGFYFFGLRLESLLAGGKGYRADKKGRDGSDSSLFPGIHFSGGYGKIFFDNTLNYNTDLLVDADIITLSGITPFVKTRLVHNSLLENAGMFPRYMHSSLESGLSIFIPLIKGFGEPYYRYSRYDESNFFDRFSQSYHTAGLRALSPGMKTGRSGQGFANSGGESIEWVNNLEWLASSGKIFRKSFYGYTWEHELALRWDIARYRNAVTYLMGSAVLNYSRERSWDLRAEAGERFYFSMQVTVYYRFGYLTREDPGNGLFRYQHLLGLRIEI